MSETFEFQAEINQLMTLIINAFYSNKDIFLRELVSNASDALDKIRFESLQNKEVLGTSTDLKIKINTNDESKILTIEDNGIGMTKDDLIKCLGTIANSGTKNFLNKLQKNEVNDLNLIGQFGVGFYSSYLVADSVKVTTKHNDDKEYVWESNANGSYTITEAETNSLIRGTKIELKLKESDYEYLKTDRIKEIIKKHSDYIQYPVELLVQKTKEEEIIEEVPEKTEEIIEEKTEEVQDKSEKVDEDVTISDELAEPKQEDKKEPEKKYKTVTYEEYEQVNSQTPIWVKNPEDVSKKEYIEFYKSFTNKQEEPIIYKHFTVEGAVNFKAILYIPKPEFNFFINPKDNKNKNMRLFVKRVYITNNSEELLPKWLNFVEGVVDSDDLPLNVSREILQQNKYMKLIKKNITKKVVEMLNEVTKDKETYNTVYANYAQQLKMGILEDLNLQEKMLNLLRYRSSLSEGTLISFDEYVSKLTDKYSKKEEVKDETTNEIEEKTSLDGKYKIIYYSTGESENNIAKSQFMKSFINKSIEVLYMTDIIDEYVCKRVNKYKDFVFKNICDDSVDLSIYDDQKEEEKDEDHNELITFFKNTLKDKITNVKKSTKLEDCPCLLSTNQYGLSANMEKITKNQVISNKMYNQLLRSQKTLELNVRHNIIKNLEGKIQKVNKEDESEVKKIKDVVVLLYEGALINSGFELTEPEEFVNKINKLIELGLTFDEDDKEEVKDIKTTNNEEDENLEKIN